MIERYIVQHFDPRNTKQPNGGSTDFAVVREGFESPLGDRVIAALVIESLIPEAMIDLRVSWRLTF